MLQLIKNWFLRNSLLVAIALSAAIVLVSLVNTKSLPTNSISISDKLLHAVAYFMLIWSWMLVFRNNLTIKSKLLIFIVLVVFGIILELFQERTGQNRSGDFKDVLANMLGLMGGLITFKYMLQGFFKHDIYK